MRQNSESAASARAATVARGSCSTKQEHAKGGREMRQSTQGGAKDVRVHCVVVRNVASAREPAKILRDLGLEEECVSNVGTTGLCHACVLVWGSEILGVSTCA